MRPERYTFYKSVRSSKEFFGEGVYLGRVGRNLQNRERILVNKPDFWYSAHVITAKSVRENSKGELIISYDYHNHLIPNDYEKEFIEGLIKRFWPEESKTL